MQLYFVKATYTNNVYKLSDFFLNDEYKLIATKMLDINFKPDDGLTSFITRNITLPDLTSVRDHTHIIIPEFTKIYRIASVDYLNIDQYIITLDEDPMIGNYLELKDTPIIVNRTNDHRHWRGVNDIADMTLKETVTTKMISSTTKTGKWALLFFQYNSDNPVIGLKFIDNAVDDFERFSTLALCITAYPEVTTTEPEKYSYFQKVVYVDSTHIYQCVYDGSGSNTRLKWVDYNELTYSEYFFDNGDISASKINESEVMTHVIALPFESDLIVTGGASVDKVLSYDRFLGVVSAGLIDIKIVNDLIFDFSSVTYSLTGTTMIKTLGLKVGSHWWGYTFQEEAMTNVTDRLIISVTSFKEDIDISYASTVSSSPTAYEPFIKYDLYVFGKKYTIPYYLSNDIHLLISINSGVVNYLIYYNDKRNILASGSFTHSIKYQIDQLDAFYAQNPTYKEQFFVKMATDSVKNIAGGAIAGSVIPGIGTVAGAVAGLGASIVDAGMSIVNLGYQEKSLRLKPDQIYGENSEVSLQVINIFGIYWVKRTSENADLMLTEYELRGFPTSIITTITALEMQSSTLFSTAKVVYGTMKRVIKNHYVTSFINQKLSEGVVFVT